MFYTSVIRSASQRALIDGPFETHEQALAAVASSKAWFCERDGWGEFDAFGTCRVVGSVPTPLMKRNHIR